MFAAFITRNLRISNRRFRNAIGLAPAVPRGNASLEKIASNLPATTHVVVPGVVKVGLWAMALFALLGGIQQQFTPRAFYDNFPGFGMQWVSVDGPYNEHLLRDLGGANLALAVVILFAIFQPSVGLVRAVSGAVLVAQAPHFVYHAAHLSILPTVLDRALQTGSLALTLVIPIVVLLSAGRIGVARFAPTTTAGIFDEEDGGSSPHLVVSSR